MDEAAYIAMTGAKQIMMAQAINSHNLANSTTTGFKADLHDIESLQINGPGYLGSRINAQVRPGGWNARQGELITTGNPLDVAPGPGGWLTVQAPDGSEAYTKAGDLRINAIGQMTTATNLPVIGVSGPIAVPPHKEITVGHDGTISIVPIGQGPEAIAVVDRLKLVHLEPEQLTKGDDGLMRVIDGGRVFDDASMFVTSGTLEASNVSVVGAMVHMIELARQYELQVKVIETADDNAQSATSMMRLS
ncbi:MAG: flagellar basal body rod protein FlgF [Pseudomonadota bacterium]